VYPDQPQYPEQPQYPPQYPAGPPVSGPPMPYGGAPEPYSAPPMPYSAPPSPLRAPPARTPASAAFKVLLTIAIVIGVAFVATATGVGIAIGSLRGDVTALESADQGYRKRQADADAKLAEDFAKADLPAKLRKVKDLTTQYWAAEADVLRLPAEQQTDNIYRVQEVQNQCFAAVIEYDRLAAAFPSKLLAALPAQIDTHDSATDCGRD
jgi:hypothetical protein